jgi:hypothetical protein|tara:strand:- start:66 stop:302 length:237 start_codon:yes stop_codon:yes gene_type:complete
MANKSSITYNITWGGLSIKIVHTPKDLYKVDHVEYFSNPCTYTETGYKSHWFPSEDNINPVDEILKLLGDEPNQQSLF